MHNFNIFICFGIILRNTTSKNKVVILTFYKAIHFDYHLLWNNAVKDTVSSRLRLTLVLQRI